MFSRKLAIPKGEKPPPIINHDAVEEVDKMDGHIYTHVKSMYEEGVEPEMVESHGSLDAIVQVSAMITFNSN